MTSLQSVLTSSLLFLSALAIASAQYKGLELGLNVSVFFDESSGENQVSLACHYHSNQNTASNESLVSITDDIRREVSAMCFLLNGTVLSMGSDHGLMRYKEWDFERGAMAQFTLQKDAMFIGGFSCKTTTERTSTTHLIYMPEKSERFTVALIASVISAVVCLGLVFLAAVFIAFVVYCKKSRHIRCKVRQVPELPREAFGSTLSGSNTCSVTNFTNPLQDYSTNVKTGQQEPWKPCLPLHMQSAEVEWKPQLKYLDPPEEVTFDCNGGRYVNADHEVELHVPRGAVPIGQKVTVRIAVSLTSPMQFPSGLKPVSPIVHFCIVNDPYFKFAKPVKLVLPHFLSVTSADPDMQFLKAGHKQHFFKECDGEACFEVGESRGTLLTDHFCHYCISSSVSNTQSKANFRLIRVLPKNRPSSWEAQFCVTYFLRTCLKSIEKFYGSRDCEVTSLRRFSFSESLEKASLEIHFERQLAGGWSLAQLGCSTKVNASEVDFWGIGEDDLKQMEEEEIYPPRFKIGVYGSQATDTAVTSIKFSGAKEELQTELPLEPFVQPGFCRPPLHLRSFGTDLPSSFSLPSLRDFSQQNIAASSGNRYSLPSPTKPSIRFLMNNVAAATSKWRAVGTQLNLSQGRLDQIEHDHSTVMDRFTAVFTLWENQSDHALPYEWSSLLDALNSPQVSEKKLASDLELLISTTSSNASLSSRQNYQ